MHYIEVLEQCLGKKAQKNMLPLQLGDVPETSANIDDLVTDVGYRPATTVEEGVRRFVDWYLEYYGQKSRVESAALKSPATRGRRSHVGFENAAGTPQGCRCWTLKLQYQPLQKEIQAAIEKVCASQAFILGPATRELEAAVAAYCQCRFGIGVSSGTDALLVALMALNIGPGDEVITEPVHVLRDRGDDRAHRRAPTFCDIEPDTFNLSPASVLSFIERRCRTKDGKLINKDTQGVIKAIMPVHLYGQVADMGPLVQIARRFGLKVIEDAAQAIGAEDAQQARAGSFGDVGCPVVLPDQEPRRVRRRGHVRGARTMRRWPSASRSCACTAASRSTTTRSSAAISASTRSSPRCSTSS